MSNRIFWVILAGGILVSAAGYLPLMAYVPSVVVPGWEGMNIVPQAALGLAGLALALLVLTGLASGWLSGAPTRWNALGAGALAGMLAALIAEALFGGVAAGLWGARNLLAHGLIPAENDARYIFLLSEGTQGIIVAVHASLIASALAGALLGGLGGMLGSLLPRSVQPARPVGPSAYLMALVATSFSLIEVTFIYLVLWKNIQDALNQTALTLPYPTSLIFSLPTAVVLLWWLFWLGVAGGMGKRTPSSQRFTSFKTLGWSLPGWIVALLFLLMLRSMLLARLLDWLVPFPLISRDWGWQLGMLFGQMVLSLLLFITAGGGLLIIVLAFWLAARVSPGFRARVREFLQRQGEARLMSWGVLITAALTVLLIIAISQGSWRQPWFSGGMVLGLGLALWGVWAARAAPPPAEEAIRTGDLFATSGLGALGVNLTLMLTSIAPLAVAQLPLGILIYLMPERTYIEEFSSIGRVANSFMRPVPILAGLFVLVLPPLTGLVAVLLRGLWQWATRRSDRERTRPV